MRLELPRSGPDPAWSPVAQQEHWGLPAVPVPVGEEKEEEQLPQNTRDNSLITSLIISSS